MKTKLLSAKQSAASKHHPSRPTITTPQELLSWLYGRLDQLEPRIAVKEHVLAAKEELLELLQGDEYIDYSPVYWVEIFTGICWDKQADPAAHRCGVPLLKFMGHLGDAIRQSEGAYIPVLRAIDMMLDWWNDWTKYLVVRSTKSRRWIESTALGVETFGCAIKVEMLPDPKLPEDYLWDLSMNYR